MNSPLRINMLKKSTLKSDHNYYILTHSSDSFIEYLIRLPQHFISILHWVGSFFYTLLSLNLFKQQSPITHTMLAHKKHTIIDFAPQTHFRWLFSTLLNVNDTILNLPFVSSIRRTQLHLENPSDKAQVDRLLQQINQLMSGKKPLPWAHIHLKGIEYLDDALHAYVLESLVKQHGETTVFKPTTRPSFFSLQTPNGGVLDSVEFFTSDEQKKPISERKFILQCLAPDQNYLASLHRLHHKSTQQHCTMIGFNYQGYGYSKGTSWTQHDRTLDAAAHVERLLLLGANRNNIDIQSTTGGVVSADVFAALQSCTPTPKLALPKTIHTNTTRRPFILACSGGGGHISAALGIIDALRRQPGLLDLPKHQAKLLNQHRYSVLNVSTNTGVFMMSLILLGNIIKHIAHFFDYPGLPDYTEFKQEITRLADSETAKQNNAQNQEPTGRTRDYADLLLDFQLSGYEGAAIYNSLQRNDQTTEIERLVNMQAQNDRWNYDTVYHRFLLQLKQAAENNTPFTEVISTQPQSLQALCDAVITYNEEYLPLANQNKRNPPLTPLIIHQYLTDLPTHGATHFFNPLARLTPRQ